MNNYLWVFVFLLLFEGALVANAAFLRSGKPLAWQASRPSLQSVRLSGVKQFLSHYKRCKEVEMPLFLWGDEIESGIFAKHAQTGAMDLALTAGTRTRAILSEKEKAYNCNTKCRLPSVLDMFAPTIGMFRELLGGKAKSVVPSDAQVPNGCEWQPEFGSWMIETVPRSPFGSENITELLNVQKSMQLRRKRLHSALAATEIAPTVSNFPMMGVAGYPHTVQPITETPNATVVAESISDSSYVSDALINPHPRFGTLTRNIRTRRGSKVNILVPVDSAPDQAPEKGCSTCPCPILAPFEATIGTKGVDNIQMDAMAFGMGCCCLQVTMQAHNEDQSRFLHDQLAVLSPILQALSAATPIFKGQLAGTDTRWNVISQAVDDRTPAERGELPAGQSLDAARDPQLVGDGVQRLAQSRYSEVALFIARPSNAAEVAALNKLNDLSVAVNEEALQLLQSNGVDDSLARHVAHLFTRDPLVIFEDHIDLDDDQSQDHFENIQSTNWRSLRWKPPALEVGLQHQLNKQGPAAADNDTTASTTTSTTTSTAKSTAKSTATTAAISAEHVSSGLNSANSGSSSSNSLQEHGPGWRTEFRPLELQLTDFENSAYSLLVVLLSRCILDHKHSLYMPMSYVQENMRRAQLKDAVLTQKFWFRRNAFDDHGAPSEEKTFKIPSLKEVDLVELTIGEIMNGSPDKRFVGVLPTLKKYVHHTLLKPAVAAANTAAAEEACVVDCGASAGAGADSGGVSVDVSSDASKLDPYFELISQRASGALPTTARWMRNFVTRHPLYTPLSGALTPRIADDLLQACEDIGMGRVQCPELYGAHDTPMVQNIDQLCEQDLMFPKF